MLRKNEAFIARVIERMPTHAESLRAGRRACYNSFAAALRAENPKFDQIRFKIACDMGAYGERMTERWAK